MQGILNANTRWSINDSPVRIIGTVVVAETATLTVDPGVTVVFKAAPEFAEGPHLVIQGALVARGTSDNPIIFTAEDRTRPWGAIQFRENSRDWDATTATGSILEFCLVEYGGAFAEGAAMIATFNARPLIAQSAIRFSTSAGVSAFVTPSPGDTTLPLGEIRMLYNLIYNNAAGILIAGAGGSVQNNYLLNNTRAIDLLTWEQPTRLMNNTIIGAAAGVLGSGIRFRFGVPPIASDTPALVDVAGNVLTADIEGAILVALTAAEEAAFDYNMSGNNFWILNNDGFIAVAYEWPEDPGELDMTGNWWGTDDPAAIAKLIYDRQDDYRLPRITFQPPASQPLEAGPGLGHPSLANAGPDLVTAADQIVTLDGSASYDPAGTATYQWQQIRGPMVALQNNDQAAASFVAPIGGAEGQTLRFRLTVINTGGFAHSDDATVTIVADGDQVTVNTGGCFIDSTRPDATPTSPGNPAVIAFLGALAGAIAVFACIRKRIKALAAVLLPAALLLFSPTAQAGYLAAGGGVVLEEDDTYNITVETGAVNIETGPLDLLFGIGLFLIPHGDRDIPDGTIAAPCPSDACVPLDTYKKGTEVGLYAKLGVELGRTNLYLTAIGGFALHRESTLVRSPATDRVYETSSDSKYEALYGGGLSYFPYLFKRQLVFQVEYDTIRGVTGTVGWYW